MDEKMKQTLFLTMLLSFAFGCFGHQDLGKAEDRTKAEPKMRKVTDIGYSVSISSDGRFLIYRDGYVSEKGKEHHVFVLNLQTRERRRLTKAGTGDAGDVAALSGDGKEIAYQWFNPAGIRELRIIGIDGSADRIIYSNPDLSNWLDPMDWSPNGSHVLAILRVGGGTYQIVLVSVANGSVRVLRSFDWYPQWGKMSFSPDGRYVAYDFPYEKGARQRDIFLLPIDGGPQIPLVVHPASDFFLGWTPDRRQILFLSDRSGTWDAWTLEIADGQPHGRPKLVKADIGAIGRSLGFTRDGSYYYRRRRWSNDVYLTTFDPATDKLGKPQKLVSNVGYDTSVAWSPDGQYLAYVFGRGPIAVGVRSRETCEERRFQLKMTRMGSHAVQPQWSPDGRFLLVQGRDLNFRQGLYRIDPETGRVTPVVQRETTTLEWPVWSPDGRLMFTRWSKPWPVRIIVVRDLETSRETELYRVVAPAGVAHLAGSPDGQRLAFVWWDSEKGEAALKVIPTGGGEPRELVKLPKPELSSYGQPIAALAWTPDSRHLIYAPSTTGQRRFELWRVSAKGGEAENLGVAMEGLLPYGLSVHPDGRRIAFTAGTPARWEVWVIENLLPAFTTDK